MDKSGKDEVFVGSAWQHVKQWHRLEAIRFIGIISKTRLVLEVTLPYPKAMSYFLRLVQTSCKSAATVAVRCCKNREFTNYLQ